MLGEPVEQEDRPSRGGRSRAREPAARQPRSVACSNGSIGSPGIRLVWRRFVGLRIRRGDRSRRYDQHPGPNSTTARTQTAISPSANPARPTPAACQGSHEARRRRSQPGIVGTEFVTTDARTGFGSSRNPMRDDAVVRPLQTDRSVAPGPKKGIPVASRGVEGIAGLPASRGRWLTTTSRGLAHW